MKKKFVLEESTLDELNKQLKMNVIIIVVSIVVLIVDIMRFIRDNSLFYGVLIVLMLALLVFALKNRSILNQRKQELIQQA